MSRDHPDRRSPSEPALSCSFQVEVTRQTSLKIGNLAKRLAVEDPHDLRSIDMCVDQWVPCYQLNCVTIAH